MRVLVTGAAGFIGSHLSEHLLKYGYQVTGIDNFDPFYDKRIKENNISRLIQNPEFEFLHLDIKDVRGFKEIAGRFDCIIHLAAKAGVLPSIKDPAGYLETNIKGTQNILEFIKERGISKYIFASSSSVYGNNKQIPFSESDNVDFPISPYAFSKKSGELMAHTYHHLYNIDVINLRFFTVYGPRQRPDLAIHKFFRLIENDRPINIYGDGTTSRDYTFINDTVQGILNALDFILSQEKVFETFNLGNNNPVKLIDLVNAIYTVAGKTPAIEFQPMQPGDVDVTFADISKANRLLNYSPGTNLVNGLEKFYEWFLTNKLINTIK